MKRVIGVVVAFVFSVMHPVNAMAETALGGTLTSVGSDTLGNLMTRWAEAFQQLYPGVIVQVQTPGSSSAPIALTEGAASFGAMSREMNADELQRFAQRYGYAPTRIAVAQDAIVVFVHPDNPLRSLSLLQLASIFGTHGACAQGGDKSSIEHWRDLDRTDNTLGPQRVLRIGRNNVSGTYSYFSEATLCGANFRADIVQLPGSGAVIAAVADHENAIGYSGIGYINALVKPLALSATSQASPVAPTAETIQDGSYPLSRPLYLYFNLKPSTQPSVLLASFFRFILSTPGQDLASREGFLALSVPQRDAQLAAMNLTH